MPRIGTASFLAADLADPPFGALTKPSVHDSRIRQRHCVGLGPGVQPGAAPWPGHRSPVGHRCHDPAVQPPSPPAGPLLWAVVLTGPRAGGAVDCPGRPSVACPWKPTGLAGPVGQPGVDRASADPGPGQSEPLACQHPPPGADRSTRQPAVAGAGLAEAMRTPGGRPAGRGPVRGVLRHRGPGGALRQQRLARRSAAGWWLGALLARYQRRAPSGPCHGHDGGRDEPVRRRLGVGPTVLQPLRPMGPERRPVPEPGYRGDAGGHLLGESTGQPQSTPRVGRLPIMKPSRISCSPVAWWGLLLALCTGLGHAQTNTRWVEGLEAVGGIPLNLVQAMTPAGPKPLASIPSARPCLSELERHRQQLENALVPANPGQPGHPAQAAQAAPAKPAPLMQGPTAAQTETLQALYNEIRTVCQESAVLESPPSVGHPHPLDLAIPTAPDGPPPRDRRALYALEAQADQEEQSLNGILALRQSTQRQLQQLQSRLPVDNGADPAAPDTPAGAAAAPWNRLIAEARLSLAGHQLQRLQGLDALLARQLASGTQASKVLQSRLSAWRGQVPFKPEELALIRTRLLDRIHRLESPAANAMARPEAVPGLPSAVSDTGMIQQGFWSQLLRQAQIDLDRRNLLAWQWRYELSQPDPGGLDTLAPQLSRQAQDLQALERSIGPLLDSASQTDTRAAAPAQALQGGFLQNELLATLALLNETRQNMRILGTELQHQLEAQNPLRRAWDRARHGVSAGASQVWDFNLLTLKEKITVNGQDITTTQNVTVGKSFGAVLVLLVGYVAGTWVLRLTRLGLVRVP